MPRHDPARCRHAALVWICIGAGATTAALMAVPNAGGRPARSDIPTRTSGGCPFAHATPGQASARSRGAALRCLVNRERRRRGIARLVDSGRLDRIARRFAEDMRNRGYFGHISPDGQGPSDRIRRARLRASGEVLAWGCARLSTPAATVRLWLASPDHRRVVLSSNYTVIGAGIASGAPGRRCRRAASTSVALVGRPR